MSAEVKSAPIGVFDSGLGGLCAVKELRRILPGEDIVYFGDTGRVPYGTRGRDIIVAYARQDIAFLLAKNVKTIVAACGTVSSTFPAEAAAALPVGYMGVVQPAAAAAVRETKNGRVGIIATEATIASGSYQRAVAALAPDAEIFAAACPLFVPLVENGRFAKGDKMARLAAEEYLAPMRAAGVDTLVLGCTHYPLLAGVIEDVMGGGVALVDTGREVAKALRDTLSAKGLLQNREGGGAVSYYVTDETEKFSRTAGIFLGGANGWQVERIDIERFALPRAER